jgi:GntR family transcriptional repressor for pyruvate dehydrogenase complex
MPDALEVVAAPRQRLSDHVVGQLLEGIATGRLAPGEELPPEATLAQRFGVSKTVVREALGQLAAMGAVLIQQGRPTTVLAPSAAPLATFFDRAIRSRPEGLREAIELRRAIETEIGALAAMRASEADIAALAAEVETMRGVRDTVDPWVRADLAFHLALARASGNALMLFLMEALAPAARHVMRLMQRRRELRDARRTLARHERILAAIRERDPEAARQALHAHFDASRELVAAIAPPHPRP